MTFENQSVEILIIDDKPLFNPYHVAECLEIGVERVRRLFTEMDDTQCVLLKNSNVTSNHIRKLANRGEKFLTEEGVYEMIFNSRTSRAKIFRRWVTNEVLPQIRKTGGCVDSKN